MSIAKSDWKRFLQLSNNLVIRDVESEDGTVVNGVAPGEWVAFSQYDEDEPDVMVGLMLATEGVAEAISENGGRKLSRSMEEMEISVKRGVLAAFDQKMDGRWPIGFELADSLRNSALDDRWGRPEDKDGAESFYELAHHLAVDGECNMMRVEACTFGVFAGLLAAKEARCAVLRDPETMLADAIEVKVKR